MTLITWRFLQAGWLVMIGKSHLIIASHEAEEMMEEAGIEVPSSNSNGETK